MNFQRMAPAVFTFSLLASGFASASDSCQSYSTTVKKGESICFAKTKYYYGCNVVGGKPEFNFVMTLSYSPKLRRNGGVCDHLDTSNLKPNGSPYGTKINRDHR